MKMIEDQGVDLLLIQKSCPHDEHLPPLIYPELRQRSVGEMVERNGLGSAIYSSSGSLKQISVPRFTGWAVGSLIHGTPWQFPQSDSTMTDSNNRPVKHSFQI